MIIIGTIYFIGCLICLILNKHFWPIDNPGKFQIFMLSISWPIILFIYCVFIPFALYMMIKDFTEKEE